MAGKEVVMETHSEDVGGWFSRMKEKDLEKLRQLSSYFEEWSDGALENCYSTFCKTFNDCEWTRVNYNSVRQFEKATSLEKIHNE